ncbi:MAG: hypothetical protein HY767_03305, partial [Candidatus Omnitrophica bacterium]|nr:hypothetical protein [Candidatus Omnitrophota bacterium]
RAGALDWTVVVSTYVIEGTESSLESQLTYKTGADDRLGTSDDELTIAQGYDAVNKVHYEQTYDAEGRVLLYKNTDIGDELRYEYDDTAKKVTITSSGTYFKQIYQFDDAHPSDFSFARLVEEERDGIKRVWDEDEQLISTTDEFGKEIETPSGRFVTSVTDKEGITTFFQDGVILSVVKRDGTVLRTYQHVVDPVTGELTDVNFEGKSTLAKVSICLEGSDTSCLSYRVIYENGIMLEYEMKGDRPVLVWVGDPLGTEFTQTTDPKTGDLTVRYNDGRLSVYSQVAGFYEIQRSTNLLGEVENYCYYGSDMGSACQGVDLEAAKKQMQSAIDALPGTGVDTGKTEFKVPELKAGDPGLDFSVKADGSITFYAARAAKEWQEIPNALFSISEFGRVTVNQVEAGKMVQSIEFRADGTIASVSKNDGDGRMTDTYRFDEGGTKIVSHSVYTYFSTDKEDEDFRLLKLVESFNVSDLNARLITELTAARGVTTQVGTLESRTHYLARHAEAPEDDLESTLNETTLGRFDYLGMGLVDYTETYLRPLVPGG